MNSTTKQEFILRTSIEAKLQYLRFLLPLSVMMLLGACGTRIMYIGTCEQQTKQFAGHIRSLAIDELNPVIDDGFHSGSTVDVMNRIEELNARVSKLNTPHCNPRTQAAKDALRLYMREVRSYFNIVAGRAVYGEGQVQGQLTKVQEAGLALEIALDDLRR